MTNLFFSSFFLLNFWLVLFNEDMSLNNGIIIPAGAVLVVPIQLVQMDVSSWGNDARKFNPYRFLSRIEERCDADQKKSLAG